MLNVKPISDKEEIKEYIYPGDHSRSLPLWKVSLSVMQGVLKRDGDVKPYEIVIDQVV